MRVLDSAGVKAYLGPDNAESVEEYGGSYEGGVEIKVMKFQAKSAYGRLQVYAPPEAEKDSPDDGYAVVCPSCNSRDVIFQGLDSQQGKQSERDAKYNWICAACGHRWMDDGTEKPRAWSPLKPLAQTHRCCERVAWLAQSASPAVAMQSSRH